MGEEPVGAGEPLTAIEAAPQFLICFDYDQACMCGPPFSLLAEAAHRQYDERNDVTRIAGKDVAGGLKRKCAAAEIARVLLSV